jgi:hypothetical protein
MPLVAAQQLAIQPGDVRRTGMPICGLWLPRARSLGSSGPVH